MLNLRLWLPNYWCCTYLIMIRFIARFLFIVLLFELRRAFVGILWSITLSRFWILIIIFLLSVCFTTSIRILIGWILMIGVARNSIMRKGSLIAAYSSIILRSQISYHTILTFSSVLFHDLFGFIDRSFGTWDQVFLKWSS